MQNRCKKIESTSSRTIEKLVDALRDFTFHTLPEEEIYKKLGTDGENGLTMPEA